MSQNAKEIYRQLKDTYGNDIEKIFASGYSSDSQCNQFKEKDCKSFLKVDALDIEKYNKEGFIQ